MGSVENDPCVAPGLPWDRSLKLLDAESVPVVVAWEVKDVLIGGGCCIWGPREGVCACACRPGKLFVRKASSSLTSIPDEARTSVSSEASTGRDGGTEGGPIVPGAPGGGAACCAIGVPGMLFGAIPFMGG